MSPTYQKLLWVWVGVIGLASVVLLFLAIQQSASDVRAGGIALGFWFPLTMTVLGALVAFRQPGNRVSWLLIGIGLAVLVEMFLQLILSTQPESPSWGNVISVVLVYSALPAGLYMAFLIPWMFPAGHFYARWQQTAWLPGAVLIAVIPLIALFTENIGQPYPAEGESWTLENPIGFLPESVLEIAIVVGLGVIALTAVSGVVSLARRYRGSSAVTRAQIRWIALSISVVAGVFMVIATTDISQSAVGGLLLVIAFTTMPVSVAVAITRYRLFDIDRIISRTVGYLIVVSLLGVVYGVGAVWLPSTLIGEQSPIFVAASTLAAAALFNPLRRRVLVLVDRRFNRSKYDTDQLVEDFGHVIGEMSGLTGLVEETTSVVTEAMQPASIGFWVKQEDPQA